MPALVTYGTGWIAAFLLLGALTMPLVMWLRGLVGKALPRRWLRPHYWLGTAAASAGVGHCFLSITRARLPIGPEFGLWLASAAAVVIVFEAFIGRALRDPGAINRQRTRQYHLGFMLALLISGGLHVLLNGPLPG